MRIESMALHGWLLEKGEPSRKKLIIINLSCGSGSLRDRGLAVLRRTDQVAFELRNDRVPGEIQLLYPQHSRDGHEDRSADRDLTEEEPSARSKRRFRSDAERANPAQCRQHRERTHDDLPRRQHERAPVDPRNEPRRNEKQENRLHALTQRIREE